MVYLRFKAIEIECMKLEEALKSSFASEGIKAYLNVLYTSETLGLIIARFLRKWGLSNQQYNILRILRGSKDQPLQVKEISVRMIHRSSNTTRIIDRLDGKGLTCRENCPHDGRSQWVHITKKGLKLLEEIDGEMDQGFPVEMLDERESKQLNELLDRFRGLNET